MESLYLKKTQSIEEGELVGERRPTQKGSTFHIYTAVRIPCATKSIVVHRGQGSGSRHVCQDP